MTGLWTLRFYTCQITLSVTENTSCYYGHSKNVHSVCYIESVLKT